MKTVYLVRHAKSSWDHPGLLDIERPLGDRGLRDAPFMAKMLRDKGAQPDVLISSPAVRALTTASFFKTAFELEGPDLLIKDEIYEAASQTILRLISTLPEKYGTVMLFGHNPTFTSVANLFTNKYIANIPTCGVVRIDAAVENWADFSEKTGRMEAYYFPKQFL